MGLLCGFYNFNTSQYKTIQKPGNPYSRQIWSMSLVFNVNVIDFVLVSVPGDIDRHDGWRWEIYSSACGRMDSVLLR